MFNFFKKKEEVATVEEFKCPYCSVVLDKEPTRKQKCKSCSKDFSVRTHYLTHKKQVLTQDQTEKYDKEKEAYYLVFNFTNTLKNIIGENEVENTLTKTKDELTKKFGFIPSQADVAWGTANKLTMEAMKKGDLRKLGSLYFQMALYLNYTGKDCTQVKAMSLEMDLKEYKKSDFIKKVQILSTGCCDNCLKLNEKVFSIDEAIKMKPLPCKDCTNHLITKLDKAWCTCCYTAMVD